MVEILPIANMSYDTPSPSMLTPKRICIIDDDISLLTILEAHLARLGYMVRAYKSAQDLKHELTSHRFDLVLCDLLLPEISGLEVIFKTHEFDPLLPVVIMTAGGSSDSAVTALSRGAFDYISKPLNFNELTVIINRAIAQSEIHRRYLKLKQAPSSLPRMGTIIGNSDSINKLFNTIEKLRNCHSNILISGESGTGKELVARTIHDLSPRSKGPFVAINCAAIPEELLESELFGHIKGAFTGADRQRKGLFEEANKGTFFLDEIGDLPMNLQAKLLRVLQEKTIRPVGANTPIEIDIRVIAATHRNLKQLIEQGNFREDLYYRLCVLPIELPPLRERHGDIPILARYFLTKHSLFTETPHPRVSSLSDEAIAKLESYPWPGNIRELENTIERATILCAGTQIEASDIQLSQPANTTSSIYQSFQNLPTIEKLESDYIRFVISKMKGHREKTAEILGIDRKTLYRKLNESTTH